METNSIPKNRNKLLTVILTVVLVVSVASAGIVVTNSGAGNAGPKGDPGPAGTDGATWLNGTGAPASSIGSDGDFYIDLRNGDVYSKLSGAWTKMTNIKGAAGSSGSSGSAGSTGAQGVKGDTGAIGAPGPQGPYLADYDSGWLNITNKAGQTITLNHNLNYANVLVDITGRTTANGDIHQKYLGLTGYLAAWNKTYGVTDADFGQSVVRTSDGGYAIAGYTYSGSADEDVCLVKIDSMGNLVWQRTYGGTGDERGYSVVQTSDGGYAIAGNTDSFGAGLMDAYLVKTRADGSLEWNNTYGGIRNEIAYSVLQTSDGGYIIVGFTTSFGTGPNDNDVYLVKINANGSMAWEHTYGGASYDYGYSVVQTSDGGYAIAGSTYSFGAGVDDAYLVKTDSAGTQLWQKTYGGTSYDIGYSVVQTSDGGYAIAGFTYSFGVGSKDVYLINVDSRGNLVWQKTYGGALQDEGLCVVQTSDGGYAIAGYTKSFEDSDGDVYLVKTDVSGEFGLGRVASSANTLTLYRGTNDVYWNYVRVQIWKID